MNGYRIMGQGNGGISGYAKSGAVVRLTDSDGGTLLTYAAKAGVGASSRRSVLA